jgi:hypothetical protein
MTVIKRTASSTDEVVAGVHDAPRCAIVRYDFAPHKAVSFLFDGNLDRPNTCQWRIVAESEEVLAELVYQLIQSLASVGVRLDQPRISGIHCAFQDYGPWNR